MKQRSGATQGSTTELLQSVVTAISQSSPEKPSGQAHSLPGTHAPLEQGGLQVTADRQTDMDKAEKQTYIHQFP